MTVEGIDIGDIAIIASMMLGILAIIVILLWQTSRSDAKIDSLRSEFRQELSALRGEFGQRLSDVELAQARQDGVNSVLRDHIHTHVTTAD